MQIDDFSVKDARDYKNKNEYAPQWPFRLLLCGSSGSGKTNVCLNMVHKYLHYDKIYIYAKNGEQAEYLRLREMLDSIAEIQGEPNYFFGSSLADVKGLESLDETLQNLVIFDDFVTEKDSSSIIDYFIRGRHKGCSILYLSQSYSLTPIDIRRNCSHFCFWKLSRGRDMTLIYSDLGRAMDKQEFTRRFHEATNDRFGFFMVDTHTDKENLKYRKGFDGVTAALTKTKQRVK